MALQTLFTGNAAPPPKIDSKRTQRAERRRALEELLQQHDRVREAFATTQGEFDDQDRKIRRALLNPTGEYLDYQAEEERRRCLRNTADKAKAELLAFERVNDIDAIQAELKKIATEEDADERVAARQEVIQMMAAFEQEILQTGAARWGEIKRRLIETESRWPGQRVVLDLPHIPDGIFAPHGVRSIPVWFRERLCAVEPGLFDQNDPCAQELILCGRKARSSSGTRSRPRGTDLSSDGLLTSTDWRLPSFADWNDIQFDH